MPFTGLKKTSRIRHKQVTRSLSVTEAKDKSFLTVTNIFPVLFVRYLTATTWAEMKLWVTLSIHQSLHALYNFV